MVGGVRVPGAHGRAHKVHTSAHRLLVGGAGWPGPEQAASGPTMANPGPAGWGSVLAVRDRWRLLMLPVESAAAETSAPPALDLSVLESLRQYDPDGKQGLLADLVATFEVEARDRLVHLRAAIALGDGVAAGRLAHSLRGICGAIGATRLAELSRELEHAAGTGHDMRRWDLESMEREYHRVAAALIART